MENDRKPRPAKGDRMKALLARASGGTVAAVATAVIAATGPKLPFWLGD